MFKSGRFHNTVDPERGYSLNLKDFSKKYEYTNLYEDELETDNHNRELLKDFGPDNPTFEYEKPRENTHAREQLNLRFSGVYSGTTDLPYRNDEYNMNFTDHDPRGALEEQNWHEMHRQTRVRAQIQPFLNDQDWSVPSQGIHAVDMQRRLVSLREFLKGRINWFSDSLDSFAAGRTNATFNTPHNLELTEEEPLDIAFAEKRQNPKNRINTGNLGGQYFINRTTTDHVLPTASYHNIIKTAAPLTPHERTFETQTQRLPRVITCLPQQAKKLLSDRLETARDQKTTPSREIENNKKLGQQILNFFLDEGEIKYLQSREAKGSTNAAPAIACLAEMSEILNKAPITVKREMYNKLLCSIIPSSATILTKNTAATARVKDILESRNLRTKNASIFLGARDTEPIQLREKITLAAPRSQKKEISRGYSEIETIDYTKTVFNKQRPAADKFGGPLNEYEQNLIDEFENKTRNFAGNFARGEAEETQDRPREITYEKELVTWHNSKQNYNTSNKSALI